MFLAAARVERANRVSSQRLVTLGCSAMRRPARSPRSSAGCLAIGCLLASNPSVRAQERVDVRGPQHFVAGDPSFSASSPGALGDGVLHASANAEYVRAPLTAIARDQTTRAVVRDQLWLHASSSFALSHRWLFAVRVPVVLWQSGDPPAPDWSSKAAEGMALGDPELMVRARLLGRADELALGAGLAASAPLATSTYTGSDGPVVRAFLAAGHRNTAAFSAFELGFSWRDAQTLPGILPTRVGPSLDLAASAGFALDRARTTRLGPELAARFGLGNSARLLDPRSTSCWLALHLAHRVGNGPFELGVAFGPSLGQAPGAADYRAVLGLAFSPLAPVPPADRDADSVPDASDMCPTLSGEPSNDPLMHGCPAAPSDADGDGIPDTLDSCPRTPGEPSLERAERGCPADRDRDADHIADRLDACPDVAGVDSESPALRGCPAAEPKAKLSAARIEISEQIQFETGTATIRPQSEAVLTEIAAVLRDHPEIERCEVAGHTDDVGSAELNARLSRERATAVLEWLVARGIARGRLTASGYGATRPLVPNATEDDRARNRRVEFVITSRSSGAAP